ncbi:MAG: outer membrane protein assembly factor BamE [Rubrivivax sp.]
MISTSTTSASPRAMTGACLALALMVSGCGIRQIASDGSLLGLVTPYRIDIVQGNAVSREQIAAVKPGMSRAEVRDILGTPLLTDPFRAERWDYLFTIRRPGTEPQRHSIVATFDGDVLKTIELPQGPLPTEEDFVASIDPVKRKIEPRVLELTEAQRKALPVPPRRDVPADAPAGATRTYPPLEPR